MPPYRYYIRHLALQRGSRRRRAFDVRGAGRVIDSNWDYPIRRLAPAAPFCKVCSSRRRWWPSLSPRRDRDLVADLTKRAGLPGNDVSPLARRVSRSRNQAGSVAEAVVIGEAVVIWRCDREYYTAFANRPADADTSFDGGRLPRPTGSTD